MIRISATQLDSFLKYAAGIITEEMLISTLLRLGEPSLKMILGTKFHNLIENKDAANDLFDEDQVRAVRNKFANGLFEIKVRQRVSTKHGDIVLTGVADNLDGKVCNEFKTCWGTFDVDKYINSVQWQVYNLMYQPAYVNYVVFEFPSLSTTYKTLEDVKERLSYRVFHEFHLHFRMADPNYVHQGLTRMTNYIKLKGFEQNLQFIGEPEDLEFNNIIRS